MKKSSHQKPSFGQGLELVIVVIRAIINAAKRVDITKNGIQRIIGKPGEIFNFFEGVFLRSRLSGKGKVNADSSLSIEKSFTLGALDDQKAILDLKDIFSIIDHRFKDLVFIKRKTKKTSIDLKRLSIRDSISFVFNAYPGDLNDVCCTESQIVEFFRKYAKDFQYSGSVYFLSKAKIKTGLKKGEWFVLINANFGYGINHIDFSLFGYEHHSIIGLDAIIATPVS